MRHEQFDVVIVGGGIIGSATAYEIARRGRRVLVVERAEVAVTPAASWASAGGVRRQGRHAAEARLASEAIARWPLLERELDADLHYRQGGNLLVAETDAEAGQLADFVRHQHALGFDDVRLLDRAEVHALVPALSEGIVAASYSPADGQADPPRVTRAFAAAAQRHGAVYWTATACSGLITDGDSVVGARTERGDVLAGAVVLTAGAWSDDLAASIGLRLPIRTRALQMVLSTPAPHDTLRPVLGSVSRPLSLKQLPDGAFLLGGGWLGDPTADRRSYALRPASEQGNWETACAVLPVVAGQRIARAWCGLEAESFDNVPFVGAVPAHAGLTLALGFSGHGFAIAPAVGRALADQLAGHPTPELDGLSPRRIAGFDSAHVAAFLAEPAPANALPER